MNTEERNKLIKDFFNTRCIGILETKGKASTGGTEDANRNFKEAQLSNRVDEIDAWWIYFIKHVTRLKNFIVNRQKVGESLEETLADIINYCCILYTILIEKGIIKKLELHNCYACGNRTNTKISYEEGDKYFCSKSCEDNYNRMKSTKHKCLTCGKNLDYRIAIYQEDSGFFCSKDCENTYKNMKSIKV
jgi:endogenous inhibitor of DNA gyrase (YacG/DUF329 family)